MEFEWDEEKNARNVKKHNLAFEDAAEIIINPIKVVYKSRYSGNDDVRYVAVGKLKGKYYAVIHTLRNGAVRIISARRARDEEKKEYRALFDH